MGLFDVGDLDSLLPNRRLKIPGPPHPPGIVIREAGVESTCCLFVAPEDLLGVSSASKEPSFCKGPAASGNSVV